MISRPALSLLLLSFSLALAGCQSKEVPASGPHPPTSAAQVELHQFPPVGTYENLGVIETSKYLQWGKSGELGALIDEMRTLAAARGANGLLFQVNPELSTLRALGKYGDVSFQIPIDNLPATKAMATAIYLRK